MPHEREFKNRAEMAAAGCTLDEQADMLLEKIASLKSQIDTAKAKAATCGDYSDREWFNRINYALRMTGKEHQQVIREIGERNKLVRREQGSRVEKKFIEVARRRLDGELFSSIMEEARDVQEAQA